MAVLSAIGERPNFKFPYESVSLANSNSGCVVESAVPVLAEAISVVGTGYY